MQRSGQAQMYRGFGDAFSVAFELAATPLLIGFLGHTLDRWLGTMPVFTVVFVVLAVSGMLVRAWYDYEARMKAHEATAPWNRVKVAAPEGVVGIDRGEGTGGA